MEIGKVDMGKKWGWYNALWLLGKEWFKTPDEVSEMHFKLLLTGLAYLKDKGHEQTNS